MNGARFTLHVLFILGSTIFVASRTSLFPPDVKICSAKDPFLNECVKNSANQMVKHLASGMRSLNAIPMDPLVINEMILGKGNNLLPTLSFDLKNVQLNGWKDGYFTKVEVDPINRAASTTFFIPVLHLNGLYDLEGWVLSVPVKGRSDFDLTYSNVTFSFNLTARLENRDGQHYLVIDKFDRKIRADNAHFDLKNLFDDARASETTNNIINSNIHAFLEEGWPVVDGLLGDVAQSLLQRILNKVPFSAMLTDLQDIPTDN